MTVINYFGWLSVINNKVVIQFGWRPNTADAIVTLPLTYNNTDYVVFSSRYSKRLTTSTATANHNTVNTAIQIINKTISTFYMPLNSENDSIGKMWVTIGF